MKTLWGAVALTACAPVAGQPATPPSLETAINTINAKRHGRIVALEVEQQRATFASLRFDKTGPQTLVDIRSAGKSITALAIGLAIAEGRLGGVDTRVWPLLGASPDDVHAAITVRDLLTMSSALDCDDGDPRSPGNEERMYRTADWASFALKIPLRADYRRDKDGLGSFRYCTAGVFLLGRVVEHVSGERFDEFVAKRIFAPLGITHAVWRRSPSGEVQSGGQLRIGAADLGRIGRMVLDHGAWQGRPIVPRNWIDAMLTPYRQPGPNLYYGYLWWSMPVRSPRGWQGSWMMMGNGGNIVALFRDYDAVVTIQAKAYNRADADPNSLAAIEAALVALDTGSTKRR